MTNSVEGKKIIAYSRAADGSLIESKQFATGGRRSGGTTDPLGSQGSLTLSQDHSRGALTVWFEANLIRFHSFVRCLRLRPKDLENCA
jgi:hypothetical protein